jgi:hypothetical protein
VKDLYQQPVSQKHTEPGVQPAYNSLLYHYEYRIDQDGGAKTNHDGYQPKSIMLYEYEINEYAGNGRDYQGRSQCQQGGE